MKTYGGVKLELHAFLASALDGSIRPGKSAPIHIDKMACRRLLLTGIENKF
jgi:hypothetical protein